MPFSGIRCKYCDNVVHDAGTNIWKQGSCDTCVRKIAKLIKDMPDPAEEETQCQD